MLARGPGQGSFPDEDASGAQGASRSDEPSPCFGCAVNARSTRALATHPPRACACHRARTHRSILYRFASRAPRTCLARPQKPAKSPVTSPKGVKSPAAAAAAKPTPAASAVKKRKASPEPEPSADNGGDEGSDGDDGDDAAAAEPEPSAEPPKKAAKKVAGASAGKSPLPAAPTPAKAAPKAKPAPKEKKAAAPKPAAKRPTRAAAAPKAKPAKAAPKPKAVKPAPKAKKVAEEEEEDEDKEYVVRKRSGNNHCSKPSFPLFAFPLAPPSAGVDSYFPSRQSSVAQVEDILDRKVERGRYLYLVKWQARHQ